MTTLPAHVSVSPARRTSGGSGGFSPTHEDAPPKGITRQNIRVLWAVANHEIESGVRPTQREVAERAGLTTSAVRWHLHRLADDGLIDCDPSRRRSIAITVRGADVLRRDAAIRSAKAEESEDEAG